MIRHLNLQYGAPLLSPLVILALATLLSVPLRGAEKQKAAAKAVRQAPKRSCIAEKCHADLQQAKFVHDPIPKNQCDACHAPAKDATAYKSGDAHKFNYTGKDGAMCYSADCHEEKEDDEYEEYLHEPIENRECIVCHDSHKGTDKYLLKASPSVILCKKCHDVEDEKELYTGEYVHDPVAKGECDVCHFSHESPYEALTRAEGSKGCFVGCHDHDGEKEDYWARRFPHKPVKENCNYCHNPHTGADKRLIKFATQRKLCFDCHKKIKKAIKVAGCEHKAIDEKQQCLNCHDEHGAAHWKLARKQFPEKFFPAFRSDTYALCFDCHEKTLVTIQLTTTLTNFRDGAINLHYSHVKGEKGHTCRICHGSHASKYAKLVSENFDFGKDVALPTNYEKSTHGGKCSPTCHETKTYDRRDILEKLVSLFDSGAKGTKTKEQTPEVESAKEKGGEKK